MHASQMRASGGDLRGRFILSGPASSDVRTGGSDNITLTNANLPNHTHGITDYGHSHSITGERMQKEGSGTTDVVSIDTQSDRSWGNVTFYDKVNVNYANISVNSTGESMPFDNRPAYYILAFIMRIQ